jgi:DNA-binding transcriptional regulator YhcF (GntR family)
VSWSASVGISCDRDRAIPLGVQLEWGLRSAIERGELAPGQRLPPLRELADEVGAHLNTIRAVYGRLESEGLIDTRHGKGSFVRSRTEPQTAAFGEAVRSAARTARTAGVTPQQLAAALYVMGDDEPAADAAGAERQQLREQIAALEGLLSSLYGQWPDLPPAPELPPRPAGPRMLSHDELVRQRDAVLERLVEVREVLAAADAPPASPKAETPEPAPAPKARRAVRPGIAPA